jgi:NAD(P)-dependent dehydrogenase (short-subunit alcohol dehydrogenase family)
MKLKGRVAVVTGGGHGIGKALCREMAGRGAEMIAVLDREIEPATQLADELGGLAFEVDVTDEAALAAAVAQIEDQCGRIDLFCSNAGVGFSDGHPQNATALNNAAWQLCWEVNVMAQVYAARAVLPGMIERGAGHLVNVASAAGLLSQIGDAAYSASKHASVGFSESLAITHGDQGIQVSLVCPQAVATRLIGMPDERDESVDLKGFAGNDVDGVMWPEEAARVIVEGIQSDRFLILTHAATGEYIKRKANDYERWIGGMRKLRRAVSHEIGR